MYLFRRIQGRPWICRNHCGLYSRLGVVVVAVFEAAAEAASKAAEAGGGCAGRGRDVIVKERTGISFVVVGITDSGSSLGLNRIKMRSGSLPQKSLFGFRGEKGTAALGGSNLSRPGVGARAGDG
ncbi:hypothetical protein JHK84_027878 [Glycine max]|nr:hypothetical protein JHK86_027763 [Glycine max]KAG5151406.1 hypothetical protein JHK84_027878 [Glycine max]